MITWTADYTGRARAQRNGFPLVVRRLFDDALRELATAPWRAGTPDLSTALFFRSVGLYGWVVYGLPELGRVVVVDCRWTPPRRHRA